MIWEKKDCEYAHMEADAQYRQTGGGLPENRETTIGQSHFWKAHQFGCQYQSNQRTPQG